MESTTEVVEKFIVDKIFLISTLYKFMSTKYCNSCQNTKSLSEFYRKNTENRHSSRCKQCLYDYQKERWIKRKFEAINLLGGACVKCGYKKCIAALEFHHLDPKQKEYDWNDLRLQPWKVVCKELEKCILVCSNCHREIHSVQREIPSEVNANPSLQPSIKKPSGACPNCKTPVYGTKFCSVICSAESKRKIKRPSRDELIKLLEKKPYTQIAKIYNVSDNAIRKWAKCYGI
jgi:hypothetical protein